MTGATYSNHLMAPKGRRFLCLRRSSDVILLRSTDTWRLVCDHFSSALDGAGNLTRSAFVFTAGTRAQKLFLRSPQSSLSNLAISFFCCSVEFLMHPTLRKGGRSLPLLGLLPTAVEYRYCLFLTTAVKCNCAYCNVKRASTKGGERCSCDVCRMWSS